MKKIRVAINGFGRIGRAFYKLAEKREEIEIVAINDLGDIENLAYLLKYDTAYGKSGLYVSVQKRDWKTVLVVNGRDVEFLHEKDPSQLPWKEFDIDVTINDETHNLSIIVKSEEDKQGQDTNLIDIRVDNKTFGICVGQDVGEKLHWHIESWFDDNYSEFKLEETEKDFDAIFEAVWEYMGKKLTCVHV